MIIIFLSACTDLGALADQIRESEHFFSCLQAYLYTIPKSIAPSDSSWNFVSILLFLKSFVFSLG